MSAKAVALDRPYVKRLHKRRLAYEYEYSAYRSAVSASMDQWTAGQIWRWVDGCASLVSMHTDGRPPPQHIHPAGDAKHSTRRIRPPPFRPSALPRLARGPLHAPNGPPVPSKAISTALARSRTRDKGEALCGMKRRRFNEPTVGLIVH